MKYYSLNKDYSLFFTPSLNRLFLMVALVLILAGCGSSDSSHDSSVIKPPYGEVLVTGTPLYIEWNADNETSSVDILLTLPDDSTVTVASDIENSGSYVWDVPLLHTGVLGDSTLSVVKAGGADSSALISMLSVKEAQASETASGAGGGSGLDVGSFASIRWNSDNMTEEYYWIDFITGETKVIGTVGDLHWLNAFSPAAVDNSTKQLFVIGYDADQVGKVYTLDSITGELIDSVVFPDSDPDAVTVASGQLLGFRWNSVDQAEEVVAIDPATGNQDVIGTVGDLMWWSSEIAVDEIAQYIYVLGQNEAYEPKIYTIDASTGAFLSSVQTTLNGTAVPDLVGLAVNSSGAVLACKWNGASEDFVHIDPNTGIVEVLGTVGDLQTWCGVTAVNPSNDNFYAVGNNGTEDFLYIMDGTTDSDISGNRLFDKVKIADFPISGLLVY